MTENDFASNGNDVHFMIANTRWSIGTEWRLGYSGMHGYEFDVEYGQRIYGRTALHSEMELSGYFAL
jgi:hypothetical protein